MKQMERSTLCDEFTNAMKKNREVQLFYKAFLKPIEISLKTGTTEFNTTKIKSLPIGLKQVFKVSIDENKSVLANFEPLKQAYYKNMNNINRQLTQRQKQMLDNQKIEYDFQKIKYLNCDNLISLMKPTSKQYGLKVAICVCMYSQDKNMLKRTLSGISKNIQTFVSKGISYNEIAVVVIMDGIQKVHLSVQQYFQQLEKQSNIYFDEQVKTTDLRQLNQQGRELEDEEIDNFNHIVFNQWQFADRKSRRFAQRIKEYKKCKEMIRQIQELEKKRNLVYEDLDETVKSFFYQAAKEEWKNDYGDTEHDIILHKRQNAILQKYTENVKTSAPIIKKALSETMKYCKEYISTRDELGLLNCFRIPLKTITNLREGENPQAQSFLNEASQKSVIKMNTFILTKYKNKGKLSSHNWFFNGFCKQLKPEFAILLDVGVAPQKQSLWKLCNHMQRNPDVGGVCGYMSLRIQKLSDNQQINSSEIDCVSSFFLNFVDIQRAQQFQYHLSHLVNKPFEASACFKFVHVLPGAFSGYRMAALRNRDEDDEKQSKILREYFWSIEGSQKKSMQYRAYPFTGPQVVAKVLFPDFLYTYCYGKPEQDSYQKLLYNENVYLAEDRILCMGIHQNGYNLAYLPDAQAWVDPIKTLHDLLGQRRRWINGSLFAFEKVKQSMTQTECNLLGFQIFFLNFTNLLSFVSPALFMYSIHVCILAFQDTIISQILVGTQIIKSRQQMSEPVYGVFTYLMDLIYFMTFFGLILYSLNMNSHNPKFKPFVYGVSTIYGIFSLIIILMLIYDVVAGLLNHNASIIFANTEDYQNSSNIFRYLFLAMVGLYIFIVVIFSVYCRLQYIFDIIRSTFSFIFYSATYLNILSIYAICRIDDISWGTKGLLSSTNTTKSQSQMLQEWKSIKIMNLTKFVLYNVVLIFLLMFFEKMYKNLVIFWMTFVIVVIIVGVLVINVGFGVWYLLGYRCMQMNAGVRAGAGAGTAAKYQMHNMENDCIDEIFQKIKISLYEQIYKSITSLQSQAKKQQQNQKVELSYIALSSKVYKKLRPLKQNNREIERLKGRRQNFSKIEMKNMSRIINKNVEKNLRIIKENDEMSQSQVNLNIMGGSGEKSSAAEKKGMKEQVADE